MSEYHRQRLIDSARFFNWSMCFSHPCLGHLRCWEDYLLSHISHWCTASGTADTTPLKVKVIMRPSKTRTVDIICSPVPVCSLDTLFPSQLGRHPYGKPVTSNGCYRVVVDQQSTLPSPLTWLKTGTRDHYNAARKRMANLLDNHECVSSDTVARQESEIILQNFHGEIIEGSVTTVYFDRAGAWVTPPAGRNTRGGLPGTCRRWALDKNMCEERIVTTRTIQNGEMIWLSNGVRGFNPGIIVVGGSKAAKGN